MRDHVFAAREGAPVGERAPDVVFEGGCLGGCVGEGDALRCFDLDGDDGAVLAEGLEEIGDGVDGFDSLRLRHDVSMFDSWCVVYWEAWNRVDDGIGIDMEWNMKETLVRLTLKAATREASSSKSALTISTPWAARARALGPVGLRVIPRIR